MEKKVKSIIEQSGYVKASYDLKRMEPFLDAYRYLCEYAHKNELYNMSISLNLLTSLLFPVNKEEVNYINDPYSQEIYMEHALSICRMMVDLHLNLSKEEKDIAYSVAICHVLVEKIAFEKHGEELSKMFQLDERINSLIHMNIRHEHDDIEKYYLRIQENKIALMVKLADRSHIVEQLYMSSIQEALKYVRDTKQNFFSMCIYGKEHYPELYQSISILMEKMRSLVDVTDILATRYTERENMMNKEILNLKEENARIRGLIKQMEEGQMS